MREKRFSHDHAPVHRVVRAGWSDPLDASFSQKVADRRWNTQAFPALYCCCSVGVARAVTMHIFRSAGIELEDLQPAVRPQIAEIGWHGEVVDLVTEEGVSVAGFAADYPLGADRTATRSAAVRWHASAAEGVCARSASLARHGYSAWSGDHRRFGELAIYVWNAAVRPVLLRRRRDLRWLRAAE